jgi:hypothetical protein
MLRPRKKVLSESALIAAGHLVAPPKTFTHALRRSQPYYYEPGSDTPDGSLAAGTPVKMTQQVGGYAWVVDAQGLRAATEFEGLRPLEETARTASKAKAVRKPKAVRRPK